MQYANKLQGLRNGEKNIVPNNKEVNKNPNDLTPFYLIFLFNESQISRRRSGVRARTRGLSIGMRA